MHGTWNLMLTLPLNFCFSFIPPSLVLSSHSPLSQYKLHTTTSPTSFCNNKPESLQEQPKMKPEMRLHLLLMLGVILLSFTAEKCRQLVGGEAASKSWTERFTFWNRFDMSYGTLAWITKELLKLYLYYIRAVHVQKIRTEATKAAITESIAQDHLDIVSAKEKGNAAAKQAYRQLQHVTAPALSSLWDVFETLYVGGSFSEGITRGIGTFVGAYVGGIYGEGKLNWIGFLVGSQLGSLAGSRLGLMVYDIGKGLQFCILLVFGQANYNPVSTYKES